MVVSGTKGPAAGYKFNEFQDIKSHSSVLYNERMAILFYWLDILSIELHTNEDVESVTKVFAHLNQIYKNMRYLISMNETMRITLNLNTKDKGIYITDVMHSTIDKMIKYCKFNGFTYKRLHIIIRELDNFEMKLKEILQYFGYFIRPYFAQKPDVDTATERYQEMVDPMTVEELRKVAGNKSKINFDELTKKNIEVPERAKESSEENYKE